MIKLTGDQRFVYDSYRRLVQMFGCVVLNIADEPFEEALDELKKKRGVASDTELKAEDWKQLVGEFKKIVKKEKGFDFPQDPYEQLKLATEAVFKSWNGKRAVDYRNAAGIPHDLALRSTSRPWFSETWETTPALASTSPATRRPERECSTATTA